MSLSPKVDILTCIRIVIEEITIYLFWITFILTFFFKNSKTGLLLSNEYKKLFKIRLQLDYEYTKFMKLNYDYSAIICQTK